MLSAMVSQLVSALPGSGVRAHDRPAGQPDGNTRAGRPRRARSHVLHGELLRGALLRECRRADRFDQRVAVLCVRLASRNGHSGDDLWTSVIQALEATRRDTDILGWLERDRALGLIVADTAGRAPEKELETRLRRELIRRLDTRSLARLSISTAAYGSSRLPGPPLDVPRSFWWNPGTRVLKRAFDLIGSVALLLLLVPVFAVLAALVKLTSAGPVFFRQTRVGERGVPFTMLKFRTMHVNAEATIHQKFVSEFIKAGGSAAASVKDGVFKIVNDPRVTGVGHVLRKTSLDELPQLWNVLRGDMSLVGPRPPLPYELEHYKPWHRRRVLEAKPGITGLWQVNGRSRTTFDDMVRLDLRYARSCSVWTDIKILLATPRAVISGKGAC